MPVNPDASTHSSRVTLRLRQCAAIAVCRLPPSRSRASSAQPAIAASDALAQPQEGHAQANAAGVRPSPVAAEDGVAGFGSGLPSIPASRPLLSRRSRSVTPKVSPHPPSRARCSASPSRKPGCRRRVRQEANALLMRPEYGSHRRQDPPARLFRLKTARRAVRAAQACPHWGRASRSAVGLYESPATQPTTRPISPKTDPNPTNHKRTRTLRASQSPASRVHSALHRSRHRADAVSRPLLGAPFTTCTGLRSCGGHFSPRSPEGSGGFGSKSSLPLQQSRNRPAIRYILRHLY